MSEKEGSYPEVFLNLLDAHTKRLARFNPRSVEEDDFDFLALRQAIEVLEHARNGIEVRQVQADSVDFDAAGAFGDKRRVFVL